MQTNNDIFTSLLDGVRNIEFGQYCQESVEMHNFIISGGHIEERTRAIFTLIYKARSLGIPTIVFHCGNPYLQPAPLSYLWGKQVNQYEPAKSKSSTAIADLLTDVGVYTLGTDRKIFSLIQLVVDILKATQEIVTLEDIVNFPCDSVMSKLSVYAQDDIIDNEQRGEFAKRLSGSAGECVSETSRLFLRIKNAWKNSSAGVAGSSLLETTENHGLLTFNLVTDTNPVLKELCFADVNSLMQQGNISSLSLTV